MLRQTFSKYVLFTSSYLLLSCTQEVPVDATSKSTNDNYAETVTNKDKLKDVDSIHLKPGAAIRLKHNYDGHSQVGESELLRLIFSESYSTGTLNIELKAGTDLTVLPSDRNFSFDMKDESSHAIDINVNANREGKHYLQMFITTSGVDGSIKNRVFAIAFYVGDEYRKDKTQASQQKGAPAKKMIFLPSEETVVK